MLNIYELYVVQLSCQTSVLHFTTNSFLFYILEKNTKSKVKNEDCMKKFVTLKKTEMVILRIFSEIHFQNVKLQPDISILESTSRKTKHDHLILLGQICLIEDNFCKEIHHYKHWCLNSRKVVTYILQHYVSLNEISKFLVLYFYFVCNRYTKSEIPLGIF